MLPVAAVLRKAALTISCGLRRACADGGSRAHSAPMPDAAPPMPPDPSGARRTDPAEQGGGRAGARGLRVLIVQPQPDLAGLWGRHLERGGAAVTLVHGQGDAIEALRLAPFDVVVLDLVLPDGSALAVADYASFARPEARVAVVTSTSFFSDGSIFRHMPNACGFLPSATPPEDLAAMVEHWGS